jgi:hypothetical protein
MMSAMSATFITHAQEIAKLTLPSKHKLEPSYNYVAPEAKKNKPESKAAVYLENFYPNAEIVNWRSLKNGNFCYFVQNDQSYAVSFDNNGNWVQTLRKYYPEFLSEDVKIRVEDAFPEYEIYYVNEFTSPGLEMPVYILQMKANQMYINLIVTKEELIIQKKFRDQKNK